MSTNQQEQQKQEEEIIKPTEEFANRILDAARTGTQNGFVIKMGRRTGRKLSDSLDDDVEEVVYDQEKRFYKHSMSAQDYKRYLDAKDRLVKESEENKRLDLTLRMYEYLALKFLGMTHDEFALADFDDVVVATLACDALFGSGGNSNSNNSTTVPQQQKTQFNPSAPPEQQPPKVRRRITTASYYKAPDEE